MRNLKTTLLTATVLASMASPAYAQFAFPTVELDAAGATTVGDVNVKVNKCVGVDVEYAVPSSGSLTTIAPADYTPSVPAVTNPELDCSTGDNIYNGANSFTGKYVGTGSGFGRQIWRNFSGYNFTGTATNQNAHAPYTVPSGTLPVLGVDGGWTNVQYSLSETPARVSDITDYNADNTELATVNGVANTDIDNSALAAAGPAIQIPLYVVPISFAYAPSYGVNAIGQTMNFNVKVPVVVNAVNSGGLRMKKATYCAIFNGQITNWNDRVGANSLQTLNGNQPLYDPLTDSATRWNSEGAPIRLVGRADSSGGTDVFTRAMAAQCGTTVPNGGTNKFEKAAEGLPYDYSSTINITGLRSSSPYFPVATPTAAQLAAVAGSTQAIGGIVFDKNGVFCDYTAVTAAVCSAPLADPGSTTPGLFTVADGSTQVAAAIASAVPASLTTKDFTGTTFASGVKINGKFGYVGADFTNPTPGRTLHSVAAQVGTGAGYAMPTAANANVAFGTVFAPESTAGSGFYNSSDSRQVYKDLTIVAAPGDTPAQIAAKIETVDRSNPLHWANILYPAPYDAAGNPLVTAPRTLANPTAGYPVTGTAQMLTYTCFSSSAKVHGVANYIQYIMGKVTKKNAAGGTPSSINLSANTMPGTAAANLGILAKSNIATVPAGWRTAIVETFLKKSTQSASGAGTGAPQLGSLNLWIQTAQATTNVPHTQTGAGAAPTNLGTIDAGAGGTTFDNRNPKCVVGGVADNASASLPGA